MTRRASTPSNRVRFLRTFARKPLDRLVFSPRLYFWYWGNWRALFPPPIGTGKHTGVGGLPIPPQYWGKSQRKIYDYLDASPRYALESLYLPIFWTGGIDIPWVGPGGGKLKVRISRGKTPTETITTFKTPLGTLRQAKDRGAGMGEHMVEYPVKRISDLKLMKAVFEAAPFHFLTPLFHFAQKVMGDRGVVCQYLPHSPFQKVILELVGFKNTVLFLHRHPSEMMDFLTFLDRAYDPMFYRIARSPLRFVNFGENLDANLSPPRYFERFLLPYYEKRVGQLHRAGKYCHIHFDGSVRDLLPYLEALPFDGIEALTPNPQGDATLEEIREAMGDRKILLDGIPAILFLPHYPLKRLTDFTRRLVDLFSPNLITGISDELPPNGDIRKVEKVGNLVKRSYKW